jgi:hypothetical protein
MDEFLLGHVEIEWETERLAHVFNMQPERAALTSVEVRPVMSGNAFFARVRLGGNWSLDLTLINQTYFAAVLSTRASSSTSEYSVSRAQAIVIPKRTSYKFLGAIIAIIGAVQILIFVVLRNYNASLNQRFEDIKAQVVVDRDNASPQIKRKIE